MLRNSPSFCRLSARPNAVGRIEEKKQQAQFEDPDKMITVKSNQKTFTEDEISRLTGICTEHLRAVARSKHLGSLVRAAGVAGGQAERWLFSNTDLSVLTALHPRCEH